ncbi:hypothetical protein E4K10_18135 [Streptomyces sp. T1317-0309]|nr:hypothetical protein E4K10_18135 [Streptomyces sp. T1317-0309]
METQENRIVPDEGGFWVIFPNGWATFADTIAEAETLAGATDNATEEAATEPLIYAGGTRFHKLAKVLRISDGMVSTVCGQRGWVASSTASLKPCRKCF